MNASLKLAETDARERRIIEVAWGLIGIKCVIVWWAIIHWDVPFSPMWIVGPTIVFAFLATAAWMLSPRKDR